MNHKKLRMEVMEFWEYQYQAAAEFGIHESRLSKIIRGREQLRPDESQRIQNVLAAKKAE